MKRAAPAIGLSVFLALAVTMLVFAPPVSALETVTIFAADCTTPQTIFDLGDTVCAQVAGVAGGDLNNIFLQWVAPSGTVAFGSPATTLITTDPQNITQALPTTGPGAELGRWTARTAKVSDSSPRVPANFDVARLAVIGVRRGSTSYFRNTNTAGPAEVVIPFGDPGDVSLMGDWDGDGRFTPGLYRPSTRTFYLANAPFTGVPDLTIPYGDPGDLPVVGDWEGNSTWTIGVYRPSDRTFYLRNSNTPGPADLVIPYGDPGDLPIVGDWDGDGTVTIGVYRPSTNTFYLRNSNTPGIGNLKIPYGTAGDLPVVGDWNADDLKSTIGIYRPSEGAFYLRNSNDQGVQDLLIPFGDVGDTPVVARVNVNLAPVVNAATLPNLPENSPNGTAVGTGTFTDADAGQSHTFSLTAGNTGSAFTIDSTTGAITVLNSTALDFETNPQFLLTVQVTDNGAPVLSGTATITVNLTNVNEAPVLTAGGTLNYTENDLATVIDAGVTVTDDSATLASATVQITSNCTNPQDVLSFTDQLGITGGYTAASCLLTLTGPASPANFQTALRSVKYNNTSESPSTLARTVTWIANDGTFSSSAVTSTINVTAVNDAPVLTAGGTLNYTENQAATAIDTTITVTDVDSTNLTGATAQITVNCATGEDVLSFTNQNGISGTAGSCSMTLSGSSSLANYITALRSVKYNNTSENPSTLARTVTWQVNDGAAANNLSNTATSTINVTAVNDVPVAQSKSGNQIQNGGDVQANMKRVGIDANLLTGVTDADNGVNGCVVTFSVASITNGSNGTVSNVDLGAGTFDFEPTAGFTGNATVNYTVRDNGNCPGPEATSAPATITLNVITPVIWFVDPNLGSNGTGTLASPFNSLASATTAKGTNANHRIFVYDSTDPDNGATTAAGAGVTLDAAGGQWLVGQGVTGASFDSVMSITPPSGTIARPGINRTRPTIQGTVAMNGNNSVVRGLNIVPSPGSLSGLTGGAVTGATVNEASVTTTTGTAVNLNGTGGTLSFTSISSNGAPNGISLTNTTGSFTVTGNTSGLCGGQVTGFPATVTVPNSADCSGGTIQSTTGTGILLASTSNVSLTRMWVKNSGGDGIGGTNVTGFSLISSLIESNGNAVNEANIDFGDLSSATPDGLHGTGAITNSTIRNAFENNVAVRNNGGAALTAFNVTGSQFTNQSSNASSDDGLRIEATGTANMTANVTGNYFAANRGDHFQADAANSGTMNVTFKTNTLVGGHATALGQTITINAATAVPGYAGRIDYDIDGNSINDAVLSAITVNLGTSSNAAVFDGFVRNNLIGTSGDLLSCSSQGFGIAVDAHGNGTHTLAVTNNTLRNCFDRGIQVLANDGNGALNLTITGNSIKEMSTDPNGGREAINVVAGATSTNVFGQIDSHAVCLTITSANGESVGGPQKTGDIRVRQRFRTSVVLPGYTPPGGNHFDTASVITFIQGDNPGATATATANDDAAVTTDGFFGGAACAQPS